MIAACAGALVLALPMFWPMRGAMFWLGHPHFAIGQAPPGKVPEFVPGGTKDFAMSPQDHGSQPCVRTDCSHAGVYIHAT